MGIFFIRPEEGKGRSLEGKKVAKGKKKDTRGGKKKREKDNGRGKESPASLLGTYFFPVERPGDVVVAQRGGGNCKKKKKEYGSRYQHSPESGRWGVSHIR